MTLRTNWMPSRSDATRGLVRELSTFLPADVNEFEPGELSARLHQGPRSIHGMAERDVPSPRWNLDEMKCFALIGFGAAWLSAAALPAPATAQDHPLLGSFQDATPLGSQVSQYDEARIIVGPIQEKQSQNQSGEGWKTVEGKVFYLYYRLPDGRTSLEALRNYEQSLKAKASTSSSPVRRKPAPALPTTTGRPACSSAWRSMARPIFPNSRPAISSATSSSTAMAAISMRS
jgi:hypothetical protein